MLVVQTPRNPAAIRHAITDLLSGGATGVRIASAYITTGGNKILFESAGLHIEDATLLAMPKQVLTCFDFGLSEPRAIREWFELPNTEVRVAGADLLERGSLMPAQAFHPKMYAFSMGADRANVLIGSANMTGRGFSTNTEAAFAHRDVPIADVDGAFVRLADGTVPLTEEILTAYENLRRRNPPPREMQREIERAPEPAPVGSIRMFREAIESGLDPALYGQMWVQVERLQGGSGNQLELPRGAHRFFGFHFDGYGASENVQQIGLPVLTARGRVWSDRPLTWHSNNMMERINLPTRNQGGFNYENSAIMFRRQASGQFELIVTEWDSDLSRAWREASREAGLLFQLGARGNRLVGLI